MPPVLQSASRSEVWGEWRQAYGRLLRTKYEIPCESVGQWRSAVRGLRWFTLVALMNLTSISCISAVFASEATIRWEIENRFRFFKKVSDFREIAKVYDSLKTASNPKPSALSLEQALEQKVIDGNFDNIHGDDTLNGWAAGIFEDTCGREVNHTYSGCQMENGDRYLEPKTANLILYADGFAAEDCEWRIDSVVVDTKPCTTPATARNVTYDGDHTLEVRPSSGAPQMAQITLKDILILSLGDSFSAGEGNPEKPVRLVRDSFNNYVNSSRGQEFPVREDLNVAQTDKDHFFQDLTAGWSNAQCHRSLYSQHTRAALQYALEHPHVSVTFLNYSCTGAEVYEGILNAWWARDDVTADEYDDAPQVVKALRDLCKDPRPYAKTEWAIRDRNESHYNSKPANFPKCKSFVRNRIDLLLLSIGGNDVGFANMVADSAVDVPTVGPLARGRSWVYGLWRAVAGPQSYEKGLRLANARIAVRYKDLDSKLKDYLGLSSDKIILSAYPQVSFAQNGQLCEPGNLGMDVHAILGIYGPKAFSQNRDFVNKFYQIVKTAANNQHWLIADQHLVQDRAPNNFANDSAGMGHGLCAAGPLDSIEGAMGFPRPDPETTPPMHWNPFQPQTWKPYSSRNRWLVTPNDSFLTTNYHDANMEYVYDPVQALYAATLSGSFHPNALGHAAIADSVLIKMRQALSAYEN